MKQEMIEARMKQRNSFYYKLKNERIPIPKTLNKEDDETDFSL